MHPVLFEIPLPHWEVRLGAALLSLALACVLSAALGRWSANRELVWAGGAGAIASVVLALALWRRHLVLGTLPIFGFGAMLCVALAVAWPLTASLSRRDGLDPRRSGACGALAAVAGLVGARLLYVLSNLDRFAEPASWPALRNGGFALQGGLVAGAAAAALYLRHDRGSWWRWADAAAPGAAAGIAIGSLGTYLFGCDYGRPLGAHAPGWLARLGTFPRWDRPTALVGAGSPAWLDHVLSGTLPLEATRSLPVHPTQLYHAVAALLLVLAALLLRRLRRFRGQVFLAFVMGYGVLRFALEVLRADPERGFLGPDAAPRVLLGAGCLVLAGALTLGPIRSLGPRWARRLAAAASLLPLAAVLAARSGTSTNGPETPMRLSIPQWLCLATTVAAALAWQHRLSSQDPNHFVSLGPRTLRSRA